MPDSLKALIESEEPERLATGFEFTEGPLWHPDGYWLFVDLRRSRIHRLPPGGDVETFREDSGTSNGLTFDLQRRLIMCESDRRRVARMEPDGSIAPIAERYQGLRLNRPNDVVCTSEGSIYFTDPNGRLPAEERELDFAGVLRVRPDGDVQALATEMENPNGLAFSPDERDTLRREHEAGPIHRSVRCAPGRLARQPPCVRGDAGRSPRRSRRHEGGPRGTGVLHGSRRLLGAGTLGRAHRDD